LDLSVLSEVNVDLLECAPPSVTYSDISPTARETTGKFYNCNADIAAAKTAIALKARRLVS